MEVALSLHNKTKMILQDTLYCAACDKEMRNEKAFATHQKSSKHLENVEIVYPISCWKNQQSKPFYQQKPSLNVK